MCGTQGEACLIIRRMVKTCRTRIFALASNGNKQNEKNANAKIIKTRMNEALESSVRTN